MTKQEHASKADTEQVPTNCELAGFVNCDELDDLPFTIINSVKTGWHATPLYFGPREPSEQAVEIAMLRSAIRMVCRESHSPTTGIVGLHIIDADTLAIAGEDDPVMPRAYVPLPDGRVIPVSTEGDKTGNDGDQGTQS